MKFRLLDLVLKLESVCLLAKCLGAIWLGLALWCDLGPLVDFFTTLNSLRSNGRGTIVTTSSQQKRAVFRTRKLRLLKLLEFEIDWWIQAGAAEFFGVQEQLGMSTTKCFNARSTVVSSAKLLLCCRVGKAQCLERTSDRSDMTVVCVQEGPTPPRSK